MEVGISRDHASWNDFIIEHSGPFFTRVEWAQLCDVYNHDHYLFTVIDSGSVLGCLPLAHLDSTIFGEALVSMPFSEHGALVVDDSHSESDVVKNQLFDEARTLAEDLNVDYLCLRGARHSGPEEFIRFTRYVTSIVDIDRSTEDIWESFETRFRNNVRSAQESNLTTHIAHTTSNNTPFDPVDAYYNLHLKNMRELGSPPHAKGFFDQIWRTLEKNSLFAFVCKGDVPINAALVFPFDDVMHYWGAVSDIQHRELNGGSQLLWNCIRWGSKHGFEEFDLGRTRPDTGVHHFKSGLNGQTLWLDDLYYFPDTFIAPPDPEDSKFQLLTRIWRQLPLSLTAALGPHLRGNIP